MLSVVYDEITGDHQKVTMTTTSAARGEITSVYAASHVYHGSFLPRTVRDTRGNTDEQTKHRNSLKTECTTNQQQTPVTHKNYTVRHSFMQSCS